MLVLLALLVATPPTAPRGDPGLLKQEAARRFQAGDWCGALYYLDGMLAVAETDKVLLNSARAAVSGGDLIRALALYERLQKVAPAFKDSEVKPEMRQLRQRLGRGDLSQSCAPPEPTCGNGLVEGIEACDDGGLAVGDGCDAVCAVETAVVPEIAPPSPPPPPPAVVAPLHAEDTPPAVDAAGAAPTATTEPTGVITLVGISTVAVGAAGLVAGGALGALMLAADADAARAESAADTTAADAAAATYAMAANITLGTSLGVGLLGGALWAWGALSADAGGD